MEIFIITMYFLFPYFFVFFYHWIVVFRSISTLNKIFGISKEKKKCVIDSITLLRKEM